MFFGCSHFSFAANQYNATIPAIESFKKQYPCALYAQWETLEDNSTYTARFVYNNQSLVAYYKEDGTAVGFARFAAIDTLPVKVKESLNSTCSDCKILSVQELVLYDKHLFYFDILNKKEKLSIGIYDNGKIKKKKKLYDFSPHFILLFTFLKIYAKRTICTLKK